MNKYYESSEALLIVIPTPTAGIKFEMTNFSGPQLLKIIEDHYIFDLELYAQA